MRIVRPLVALLVALSVAVAVLSYLQESTRGDRIYIRPSRQYSSNHRPYHERGFPWAKRDPHRIARANSDPYHQRYYSQSDGWTYYTLPSHSSVP